MALRRIAMRPLAVALRGEEGSVAYFECEVPADISGKPYMWATCGQRRRFLVPTCVKTDRLLVQPKQVRLIVATVQIPAEYTACTLHVFAKSGKNCVLGSCRIHDSEFHGLAPSLRDVEKDSSYHDWFMAHRTTDTEHAVKRNKGKQALKRCPLISIVTPVFRTPELFLTELLNSILNQTYGNFELVCVNVSGESPETDAVLACFNDRRIRVIKAPNRSIPENTNVGIQAARGDYIGFVDHDDFIEPDTLFRYVEAINAHPECDLLFCDEDQWDSNLRGGHFCGARFKPGWNPDMLFTHNYVCHLLMVSRRALECVELSGSEVNGAQDYDLTLKVSEVAREIIHVPYVLYHWRRHAASTASNSKSKLYAIEAGRKAVQNYFDRRGIPVNVETASNAFTYRPRYQISGGDVSIILRTSKVEVLRERLDSFEVGACSYELCALSCEADLNGMVNSAAGDYILVLDESVASPSRALLEMLQEGLMQENVGCVAPVLCDCRSLVVSAGYTLLSNGEWRNSFAGYPSDDLGYLLMLEHAHDVLAVSLRCMMFKKNDFIRVGGFDLCLKEELRAIDFCLKLWEKGVRVVMLPYEFAEVSEVHEKPVDAIESAQMLARHPLLAEGDFLHSSQLDEYGGLL